MTDTVYQQLRAHVHDLRLGAVAEQLAPALEQAERNKPSYMQFLADLLAHEVAAVEQRRLQGPCASPSSPPAAPWTSSTSAPNPRWTGDWSRTSPRCASSRTERISCSSARPTSARRCWPRSSATKRSRPATASTTPPPPTSSPA